MVDGYVPYPVGEYLRNQQVVMDLKRCKREATTGRERVKLLERRVNVLELAIEAAFGRHALGALKATHPELWPDDRQRTLDLGA